MELIDKIKRLKKPNALWHKYYKQGNEKIELNDKTIYEYLEEAALKYSKLPAIEYFGKQTTFKDFLNQIDICAKSFKSIDIKKGDVVTICMANTPEALITFYALNKIGAIANMIHPLSAEEEIKNYLINNRTSALIAIDLCFEKIENILNETSVKKVILVSAKDSMPIFLNVGYELTQGRKVKKPKQSNDTYIFWKDFFKLGKTKILISTTVIEVGVDVKNATMIVIFNAERFGLATLHQLRGRVGRNDLQCYCYLISNHEVERLRVLEESNDGFYISEKDFELRGQGDLFGVSQSGDMCFKIADIKRDYKILLQAKKDADSYLKQKEYINDLYYKKMMDQIHFTN